MVSVQKGDLVSVPCTISEGVAPNEVGITIETIKGPVSGFIRDSSIIRQNDQTYVVGVVLDIDSDRIALKLQGSFFTTTGIVYLDREKIGGSLQRA